MIYTHTLERALRYYPERTALASGDNRCTFRELHERVAGVAATLTKHGFKRGDRLAILLPNELEYIELIYAIQNNIAHGAVQNSSGNFVKATVESVTAAAEAAAPQMPADFRVSITNPGGASAYPIASFTWLLLYKQPPDKAQGRVLVDFVTWALTDGQKFAQEMGYAPLPKSVIDMEMRALQEVEVK